MKKSINSVSAINLKGLRKIITAFTFLLLAGSVFSQTISIQGVLRDPNGRSVDDGSYSVTFKIYDAATDGTALWADTYTSLKTKHGVFQANLGEQTTLDGLGFDAQYYVGVTVEAFAEMTPRIALTIYPYAKAILGQDNKFPSTGNVEMDTDDFIIHEGELRLAGAGGRILFNDGTSLNTANFGGPAGSLLNSSDVNINADNIADFSGAINFQTRGTTRATIYNDGNATFEGQVNAKLNISSGTYNAASGALSLYGADAGTSQGGLLNLFTSDTRTTEKWFMQTNENDLVLGHETGGAFPTVATFTPTSTVISGNFVVTGSNVNLGQNDAAAGFLNIYGDGTGSAQGGRISLFKAADHDASDVSDYWFMEAINDDLRIGNVFSNNDVMTFDGTTNNIGIGAGVNNPAISLAIGDHDTGINWVQDGAFNLMSNGVQALTVGNNGQIGVGDNTPIEARLVVRGAGSATDWTLSYFLDGFGHSGPWASNPWSRAMSIFADGSVAAGGGFFVVSDERIKEIVGRTNTSEDLEKIMQLQITDYAYVDKAHHGDLVEKKLIAQEVKKLYPRAITERTDYIPNVYQKSQSVTFSESSQLLTLKLEKEHGLIEGELVKLITKNGELSKKVLPGSIDKVLIVESDKLIDEVFVYGKQVDDFLNVDYDAIAMLNVSATQELAKQVEALQKENEALKKKLAKIDLLEAKLNALLDPTEASSDVQVGKE